MAMSLAMASPALLPLSAIVTASGRALLPNHFPRKTFPVGIAFITASISAPGLDEALEHQLAKDHPLRPLFLTQSSSDDKPQRHQHAPFSRGRACMEYNRSGDVKQALPYKSRHVTAPELRRHGGTWTSNCTCYLKSSLSAFQDLWNALAYGLN